jgi:hypothetical protein
MAVRQGHVITVHKIKHFLQKLSCSAALNFGKYSIFPGQRKTTEEHKVSIYWWQVKIIEQSKRKPRHILETWYGCWDSAS